MAYTEQEIYQSIVDIIASVLSIDKQLITKESTFESLGADSLDMLEIIMKLEEKFSLEISDEQASQIKTVGEAAHAITSALAKK